MFCPKCGKKNNDQASFCTGCGYSFAIDLVAGSNQKQAAMAPRPKQRRRKRYVVASVGLAVAVVSVVIGAGIFFRSNTVDAWLPSRIEMTNSLDGDATTEIYEIEYSKNSVTVNSPTRDDSYTYEFEGDTCTVLDENGEEGWCIQASRDDRGRVTTAQSTEGEVSIDYSYDDNSVIREVSLPSPGPMYASFKMLFDEKGFKTGSEFLYADGVKTGDGVDLSGSKGYELVKYDYLGADENGTQYKSMLLNDDGDELATGTVVVDSNGNQVFQSRYFEHYSRYWEKRTSYEYVQGVDQFMVALFWSGFTLGVEV